MSEVSVLSAPSVRRFKPYPHYKQSRVEWLGEIPEHWNVRRLKYLASFNDEALREDTDPNLEILYVDIENVDATAGILGKASLLFQDAPSRARRMVRGGDVIISTVRTYLRAIAAISNPEPNLIVSTGFAVIRPRVLDSSFAAYAFRAPYFVDLVVANSVGVSYPAINASEIACFPVAYPAQPEQRAIAAFLDRETARIDALVTKMERLIALLLEKRTALISHAVTKGLDPTVPMKDSGVEWLGQIPRHWDVVKLKQTVRACQNGVWGQEADGGVDDIICVRVADFDRPNLRVSLADPTFRSVSARDRQTKLLRPGDLLLEKSGGGELQPVGAVMLYDHEEPAVCSNFVARVQVAHGQHPDHLCYLHAAAYSAKLNTRSIKQNTGIQNLDSSAYFQEMVALPLIAEQRAIAAFLDRETARIDALAAKAREAIERLKEYRTALISAAVTGKIDVRGEVDTESSMH